MANETRANRWLELVAEDMSVAEDLYKTDARMDTPKVLRKEEALELVRKYKEIIAPRFNGEIIVMMFGSYSKGYANPWSDIDVAVIVPKIEKGKWFDWSKGLNHDVDKVSLLIEPILLEKDEDSPIYREVMRTGIAA